MLLFALSLFFTNPVPLDMPRASAYLVNDDGRSRLEDRYDKIDLWFSQSVIGRWIDDDGREFVVSALDVKPPSTDLAETLTRVAYDARKTPMPRVRANHDLPKSFIDSIGMLSQCPIVEFPRKPRQLPHGYRDVTYWQSQTNLSAIVCAFRKEKSEAWYLATWLLANGDDVADKTAEFEDKFLGEEFDRLLKRIGGGKEKNSDNKTPSLGERELLRRDARHSIVAYPEWHAESSAEFELIFDFKNDAFVNTLTNELATMRAKYSAALPTPIDGSNVLAVARIYDTRDEYLDALVVEGNTNMEWTAAYWSSIQRELVAYRQDDEKELLKTMRHEAFHQYISYATSMIAVSPWLNEGYAEYFEDLESEDWGDEYDTSKESLQQYAKILPGLMAMDYDDFYSGSDAARRFKYRLAWSIARFLEKGAEKVRFQPFKDVKRRYIAELLKSGDMQKATAAAFENEDKMKLFVVEWVKYWNRK